jgi:hypothetical protein
MLAAFTNFTVYFTDFFIHDIYFGKVCMNALTPPPPQAEPFSWQL